MWEIVHLFVFIIRIHHDVARSSECQNTKIVSRFVRVVQRDISKLNTADATASLKVRTRGRTDWHNFTICCTFFYTKHLKTKAKASHVVFVEKVITKRTVPVRHRTVPAIRTYIPVTCCESRRRGRILITSDIHPRVPGLRRATVIYNRNNLLTVQTQSATTLLDNVIGRSANLSVYGTVCSFVTWLCFVLRTYKIQGLEQANSIDRV